MGYQNDLKYHKMILLLALKGILDHPYILHSFLRYRRYKFSTQHNGGIPSGRVHHREGTYRETL